MARGVNPISEGEGNKTAAHEYNEAQRRFVKSGAVEAQAKEAAQALDGPEAPELAKAEMIGKSHIAEEDPQVGRDYHEQVKRRAYDIWEEEGRPHGRDRETLAPGGNRTQKILTRHRVRGGVRRHKRPQHAAPGRC